MKKHLPVIFFLFFYFIITAYKLIVYPTPFYDWDEAIYAQVGKEMVEKKSLIPLWQGQNWLDKPPLTPLVYGIVQSFKIIPPEISTRIFTLLLSIGSLALTYYFYYRLTKNITLPLLTVVITAFTPIFLQRSQVLNVDVFLFLGWMGYLVFRNHFWISLIFLTIGVLSKSLLGFYPAFILLAICIIQSYFKQINKSRLRKKIFPIILQISIISMWYLIMLIIFKFDFIKAHFLESMVKRVTNSIESHFGKRTFYIDVIAEQLGIFFYLSILGFIFVVRKFLTYQNKQSSISNFVLSLCFIPWFLFLNLTKTKISWYLYPVIAQFAFLGVYFLSYFKNRLINFIITFLIIIIIFNQAFKVNKFFSTFYSNYDQYYELAVFAGKNCSQITLLIDPSTRQTYETLSRMNLTISTTSWWGNHPSIVYYSGKKVNFIYSPEKFQKAIKSSKVKNECFVLNKEDQKYLNLNNDLRILNQFKELSIFVK